MCIAQDQDDPEVPEMTTATPQRRCGNCGAAVNNDAITCLACDALLAAYEAPVGSATTSSLASSTALEPVAMPEAVSPSHQAQPVVQVTPPVVPPVPQQIPQREPFDARAALEEARRTLGMPTASEPSPTPEPVTEIPPRVPNPPKPEPQKRVETPVVGLELERAADSAIRPPVERTRETPTRVTPTRPATSEGKRASLEERQVTARARQRAERLLPPPVEDVTDVPPSPRQPEQQPVITPSQVVRWGIVLMIFLVIMGRSPMGISSFMVIIFAFVILSNVMKLSAKAGGRKSTWMDKLNDSDPWNRQ
jgi:hypothetical protein